MCLRPHIHASLVSVALYRTDLNAVKPQRGWFLLRPHAHHQYSWPTVSSILYGDFCAISDAAMNTAPSQRVGSFALTTITPSPPAVRSSTGLLPFLVFPQHVVGRRKYVHDRPPRRDPLFGELIIGGSLQRLRRQLLRYACRKHHDPVAVADYNVPWIDCDPGTTDGHVKVSRVQTDRCCRGRCAALVGGKADLDHAGDIAETAIRDDPGAPADLEPTDHQIAGRSRARVVAGIDDQHAAWRTNLQGSTLHVVRSPQCLQCVD